jgi:hypothetical protein
MLYLLLIGLIVNFVGIVLIAISFGGTVEGAQQRTHKGAKFTSPRSCIHVCFCSA